jgi:CheY-like chemotaxis protein
MSSAKPRVLVVDDEADIREVMERLLVSLGCEVVTASSADEAVKAFLSGPFDLITLDHRMPGLHGMDLHKVLSQEFGAGKRTTGFSPRRLPPVLVVTGFAEDPEIRAGQWGEGIVGVLQKPLRREELERAFNGILRGRGSSERGASPGAPRGREQ